MKTNVGPRSGLILGTLLGLLLGACAINFIDMDTIRHLVRLSFPVGLVLLALIVVQITKKRR